MNADRQTVREIIAHSTPGYYIHLPYTGPHVYMYSIFLIF